MVERNDFDELRRLSISVLSEVVREGELRLQSQLQIATAADQRALTFVGFQIASATASLAGGVALIIAKEPNKSLAYLAVLFALILVVAAVFGISTVWPRKFSIPGNDPLNWRPSEWCWQDKGFGTKAARIEQAYCLQTCIEKNQCAAAWAAGMMHWSMALTAGSGLAAGLALLAILADWTWPMGRWPFPL